MTTVYCGATGGWGRRGPCLTGCGVLILPMARGGGDVATEYMRQGLADKVVTTPNPGTKMPVARESTAICWYDT